MSDRAEPVTDDDLMRMFRDGDADAFDTLFDRHYAVVYRFARALLTDGAEEALQETFLAVARAADRYEPRGHFRTWLLRIVRNRCLNRLEAERARRAMMQDGGLRVIAPASPDPSPPQRAEMDERLARVRAAVAELPDRQREALSIYAFEQMSYREIAAVMTMPVNTVKTLIHRARAAVAAALEDESRDL
jgi:RNA polymerase sigma-70 factor (ECF subfamily)